MTSMKRNWIRIAGLTAAATVVLSCGVIVFADETESAEVPEAAVSEVTEETEIPEATEEEAAEPGVYCEIEEYESGIIDFEYDNDYLAEQYIAEQMTVGPQACLRSYDYSSRLSGYNQMIFINVGNEVTAIANGTRSESVINTSLGIFTASELGLSDIYDTDMVKLAVRSRVNTSLTSIVNELLNAYPYELYWFDKTQQFTSAFSYSFDYVEQEVTVQYIIRLKVADEYKGSDEYHVNPTYGTAVRAAVANARSIIDSYAPLDDYDKLAGYCDYICQQTEYNHPAADDDDYPYGNPWQMIWVFDGDPSTTVVCEGYSKAFQFLCDNSSFQSNNIYAISVTGNLRFSGGSGGAHMWNMVHMDNGRNYLVDVTNHDGGKNLFLRGMTGSVSGGYTLSQYNYYYTYDLDTTGSYTSSDLTVSSTDYSRSVPSDVEDWRSAVRMYWYSYAGGSGRPMDAGNYGPNETVMEFTCKVNNSLYSQYPIYYSVYYTPTGLTSDSVRLVHTSITPTGYRDGSSTTYFYECRYTNDAGFNTGYYIFIGGLNAAGCDINSNPSTRLFYQVATVTAEAAGTVDMYRMYNEDSGEHLYTANAGERDWLRSVGWNYEGVGWTAPAMSDTPVYRLYNEGNGEHLYIADLGEISYLVDQGWNNEGIAFYSNGTSGVPIYRLFNPNEPTNNHHFTTNVGERDWLDSIGWNYEGVAFCGVG